MDMEKDISLNGSYMENLINSLPCSKNCSEKGEALKMRDYVKKYEIMQNLSHFTCHSAGSLTDLRHIVLRGPLAPS